jgi:hypothetical protein
MAPGKKNAAGFIALAWAAGFALAATTALFAPPRGLAQETAGKNSPTKAPAAPSAAKKDQAQLLDVTRVSTEQAVHKAARSETAKKPAAQPNAKKEAASGVVELQPASHPDAAPASEVPSPARKKSPLKDIHGSVYGDMDSNHPAAHRTGGDVGASTKSGKASIYVQTEQSHSDSGPPQ